MLALLVTRADFCLALAVRQSAQQTGVKYGREPGTLWYQGHWGFQFYMDAMGALPLDIKHSALKPGDALVVPENNTSLFPVNSGTAALKETICRFRPALADNVEHTGGRRFFCGGRGAAAIRLWPCAAGKCFRPCLEITRSGFRSNSKMMPVSVPSK